MNKASIPLKLSVLLLQCLVPLPAGAERWVTIEDHGVAEQQIDLDSILRKGDIAIFNTRFKLPDDSSTFGLQVGEKVNCKTRQNWKITGGWTSAVEDFPDAPAREWIIRRLDYACYSN